MTNTTTQQIAQALGETELAPRRQITAIIQTLGADVALQILQETQAIEANGGMHTTDGTRRRTPGGVFFQLARTRLPPEQRLAIFGHPGATKRKQRRPATSAQPGAQAPAPTAAWADRMTLLQHVTPGKATTVKVTLIGRPTKVQARADFTLLLMKHSGPLPSLPKGLPVPDKVPETSFAVFISAKQWRAVAEALKNPDDVLIVEGVQFYDNEMGMISVFATNSTTKGLQQAKRQQRPQG